MANRFLNDLTTTGAGVSTGDLNVWFETKTSDDLAQGIFNLYMTSAEKAILSSLTSATSDPTPGSVCKRDSSGSSSFYNISAVGLYLRPGAGNIEPSITLVDTAGSDGNVLYVDRDNNVPNLYLSQTNNSGILHLHSKANVYIDTSKGSSTKSFIFDTNGDLSVPNNITSTSLNINFSGNSISPNQSLANLNLINTNPNGNTKSSGIKLWLSDTANVRKNIGHIYVRSDNDNVVAGDLVLANSVVDYEANPSLTCRSDGRVYVNGLSSSGTLVSSSGVITTNISCGFIHSISGLNVLSNISAVKITTPDLIVNSTLISNGTAQFISLTSNSGTINQLSTNQLLPSTSTGSGLGVYELKLGVYSPSLTNDVYISTGSAGTLDMRADTILFKGAGNSPQFATFDSTSVRFFRNLQTNSGIITQNLSAVNINIEGQLSTNLIDANPGNSLFIQNLNTTNTTFRNISGQGIYFRNTTDLVNTSGHTIIDNRGIRTINNISCGVFNTSGLLASKATILGSTGVVQGTIGTSTDNINVNAFTNDTLYLTTAMTTASGFAIGTGNQHRMSILTNNIERIRITGNSGYVGIGNASPTERLQVNGNCIIDGTLTLNNTGTSKLGGDANDFVNLVFDDEIRLNINLSGLLRSQFFMGTNSVNPMIFRTNGLNRLRITGASGFVCVGTASPTEKLQVDAGNVRANALIQDGSSLIKNYQTIGAVTNNSTWTLPSGRWSGEITLSYGNDSGRVGNRKYAFSKAPGAAGNGYTVQQLYHYTSGGSDDSSITFDQNAGTFTFSIGGVNATARAYIEYYQSI